MNEQYWDEMLEHLNGCVVVLENKKSFISAGAIAILKQIAADQRDADITAVESERKEYYKNFDCVFDDVVNAIRSAGGE